MNGGGVGQSLIPTQPTHPMKRGKNDVGDAVEGGHLKDPQVIPPLSSGSVPLKRERRMFPLRITSREVLAQSDYIHALRAMDEVSGGVDGANLRFQFPRPMSRHNPEEGANCFGGGHKADGPQLGEGQPPHPHARVPSRQYG